MNANCHSIKKNEGYSVLGEQYALTYLVINRGDILRIGLLLIK